jgi:putative sigma-54 modulation protein
MILAHRAISRLRRKQTRDGIVALSTRANPLVQFSFLGQSTRKESQIMNSAANNHEVIVSGIHLDLTPSLKFYVNEKVGRLLRHEERIIRIRVELEFDGKNDVTHPFIAKGHIIIHGPEMTCSIASDDCHKSVDLLVDRLDRMLRRRSRLLKVKRNHPHAVELATLLPKTA